MDENTNLNPQPEVTSEPMPMAAPVVETPVASAEPTAPTPAPKTLDSGSHNLAHFGHRFLATLIDVVLLTVVFSMLGMTSNTYSSTSFNSSYSTGANLAMMAYYIIMLKYFGATLGKMALKIKVVPQEGGETLTWGHVLLREVVGKFLSAIVFFLGFFWMIWDDKKQGWHDKIAKTLVVRTK